MKKNCYKSSIIEREALEFIGWCLGATSLFVMGWIFICLMDAILN
jgi:hypothetical protein